MKKIILTLNVATLILLLQSCKDPFKGPYPTKVIPNCSWDNTEQIVFYDLQLKYPAELSDYHTRLLPLNKIDRSFIDVILRNSDVGSNGFIANIRANVKSDGTKCIGEKTTTYDKSNYTTGLGANMVKSPFPSNTAFVGEITVTLNSNIYRNSTGSGAYYHILWEQTGNNPNGGMPGIMIGKKISYHTFNNGRSAIVPAKENDFYLSGGKKIML
jgi:hypothetical protein